MSSDRELFIKRTIVDNLETGEYIASLSDTRSSESMYAALINDKQQYLTFRISHHSTYSGFLSIPTFVASREDPLEVSLKDYMQKATWINLDYNDFFVLSVIKLSREHGVSFQVDDLYSIFTEETQGMMFYQVRTSHHKRRVKKVLANGLNESTNQVFRKLYSTALISTREEDGILRIYISAAGIRLLDLFAKFYIQKFSEDYKNVDWNNIVLPIE